MAESKRYSRLPSSDDGAFDLPSRDSAVPHGWRALCYLSFVSSMIFMLGLGYLVGTWRVNNLRLTDFEPVGDLHYYMHFNASFPRGSNAESDALWSSLFPEKLGFIQHPKLAPDVAGIAVFHELHCLNILRMAYFASLDGKLEEMGKEDQEANHRTSHHHIRHCFEYLRQSLICLADTNLEEFNYTARGVSGWETERTCRNFEGLKVWADDWGISREDALRNSDLQA
ncbi:hypothetical protein GGS23DRAFT_324151 [Durotheca rogersii]|uniref:uncharacterized protein n=1 Tax=Durotheca rogersii TaxID=419775 RepID=UPI00221FF853|nr:uncharacterized protein GGS23DRAFT_324151 [Durotheca rogersii]KAI5859360.1 hypothetical protein GGS23DRAFT_324151 [Durotheca rogersii]